MADSRKFLKCIVVADVERIRKGIGSKKKCFSLQTLSAGIINTKERFFEAVNHSLPLDPPGVSRSWDALDDSLYGGLLGLRCPNVCIIWPFANDVAASSMRLLVDSIRFFGHVAENVNRDDLPEYVPVDLKVFLVCSNEKSKRALEADLWSFL